MLVFGDQGQSGRCRRIGGAGVPKVIFQKILKAVRIVIKNQPPFAVQDLLQGSVQIIHKITAID